MSIEFRFEDVKVRVLDGEVHISEGRTGAGIEASGTQYFAEVSASKQGWRATIALTYWDNGEADVKAIEVDGNRAMGRLERGSLRLGIQEKKGFQYFELRQARIKPETQNQWSNLFNATEAQLDEGAGTDVRSVLMEAGALKIDMKEHLLKAEDKTKLRLCAQIRKGDTLLPIIAFVLTRVMPLANEYEN